MSVGWRCGGDPSFIESFIILTLDEPVRRAVMLQQTTEEKMTQEREVESASEKTEVLQLDEIAETVDLTRTRLNKIEGFEFLRQVKSMCLRW
jgi:hypothetical protein